MFLINYYNAHKAWQGECKKQTKKKKNWKVNYYKKNEWIEYVCKENNT